MVTGQNIADSELIFEFTCQQWSEMDDDSKAEWTVLTNTCGAVNSFGNPYASYDLSVNVYDSLAVQAPLVSSTVDGVTTLSIPAYLEPVSLNTTDADITAGAVTSIDVVTPLLAGEYRTGDVFSVINNENGEYLRLTVTANTTGGATSISVTGTATETIPSGSILVPIYSERATAGTVTSVAATAPAAGFTISGSPITGSGTFIFALADDLAAVEGISGTGVAVRTGTSTWTTRTVTAGTGISVSNGDGVSGNPTITNSAPDQTVVLTAGSGIIITGTYPNFTIAASGGGSDGNGIYSASDTIFTDAVATVDSTFSIDSLGTESVYIGDVGGAVDGLGIEISPGSATFGDAFAGSGYQFSVSAGTQTVMAAPGNLLQLVSSGAAFTVLDFDVSSGVAVGGNARFTGITTKTNTVEDRLVIITNSSGTAAAGFGGAIVWKGESSTTDGREMASLSAIWTTATDASRTSALVYSDVSSAGALTERFRFTPTSMTNAVAYTIGNSANALTVGGSTGTVTVQSNDSGGTAVQIRAINNTGSVIVGNTAFTSTTLNKVNAIIHDSYTAASGSGTYIGLSVRGQFDLSGTSGVQRCMEIKPTIVSLGSGGLVGIDCAISDSGFKFINQTGANSVNYMVGKTAFGSTTAPTDKLEVTGNLALLAAGNKIKIATGSNAAIGTATMVAGTVTVSTTAVATGSKIFLQRNTTGGTLGELSVPDGSITNGTSFVINSSNAGDTSTVNWIIYN